MYKHIILANLLAVTLIMASSPAKPGVVPSQRVMDQTAIMGLDYAQGGLVAKMQRVKTANDQLVDRELREDVYMSFPVLLGSYRDHVDLDTVISMLQRELFDGPWPTPTMAGHYLEMSYGQFHLSGTVYGWYEMSQNGAYYEGSQSEPYDNGFGDPPGGTGSFLKETLDLADLEIDFAQYDSDGPDGIPNSGDDDGFVDAAFFVHTGRGGEGGGAYIWSHRWTYSGWWGTSYRTNDMGANGSNIRVNDYIIQPAVSTNSGLIEIGVFSHEFGHALGLPDLYDTDYSSGGVGSWCLMAGGSWSTPASPVHMSAWCKEMLGWTNPQQPTENMSDVQFPTAALNPFVLKLWTHGIVAPYVSGYSQGQDVGREYYLIENRQRQGTEQHLPGTGLIIWHIDNSQWGNNNENHRMVDVMPADGFFNGSSPGDAWPGTTDNHNFDFETFPSATGWDGQNTQVAVLNISADDTLMTADVEVHEINPHIRISEFNISDDNNDHIYAPGETIEIWLSIENTGGMATNLTAMLTHAGDAVDIFGDLVAFDPIDFMGTAFANDPFEFVINDTLTPQAVVFDIAFSSDEMLEPEHQEFTLLLGLPQVALIDDDGASTGDADYQAYFRDALAINDIVYAKWDIAQDGVPDLRWLQGNSQVVWFTGNQQIPLDEIKIDLLSSYLEGGGKLLLSGQDIGSDDLAVEAFLEEYLGARVVDIDVNSAYVYGDPEHALMDAGDRWSLASSAAAGNQGSPDALETLGEGESLFIYPFADLTAGVSVKNQTFSSIYLGFGLEALAAFTGDADTARSNLIQSLLQWLDLTTTDIDAAPGQIPEMSRIASAYPNPFNPEIRFKVNMGEGHQHTLDIFDIRGVRIASLDVPMNGELSWHPEAQIAGGLYFARLHVDGIASGSFRKVTYLK